MLAQTSGQLCNFSQLGGQIGLDHKTVGKYLAVFKQMFLMQHVPVWSTSRLGRLIEILKLQISVVPESQGRSVSRRHASADFFRSLVGASRPSSTTVSSHEGCPAATLVARSVLSACGLYPLLPIGVALPATAKQRGTKIDGGRRTGLE